MEYEYLSNTTSNAQDAEHRSVVHRQQLGYVARLVGQLVTALTPLTAEERTYFLSSLAHELDARVTREHQTEQGPEIYVPMDTDLSLPD